ncbi:carbon-nitrogen hydrolase family protein [Alteromonas pelagimontana]|uniref:Carbon-nitrogen hydrolase family protein n=1 Tax=Alteromonas pelagimontana TaxID=1858656 RepID=A0A6M4MFA4_9ALTE|nr:carbon-nitrogen hydrolase family protein [Alteromonas pelagimontana]QJR81295.1 carbon-nitrogen hydrolase family protein [Alteromonas pelagimontana]
MVNLVAAQMTSVPDINENLDWVEAQLATLPSDEDTLVVLPECFACFGSDEKTLLDIAESRYEGKIQSRLSSMAKSYGCYIVSGTLPLHSNDDAHFTASCLLIDPQGVILGEYQKIHLFDVEVNDSTRSYKESKHTQAGQEVVVLDTPIGRIGLAVCYDVRFPGLFEAMGDIDILALPAAFTRYTGDAHWHTLLRARAIEKQCFVVGAGQTGVHANQRETYGHSLIYSPWGDLLAEQADKPGMAQASVDIEERKALETKMPLSKHNRFRSHFVK